MYIYIYIYMIVFPHSYVSFMYFGNKLTRVIILDEGVCSSHGTNTLRKDMQPTILPTAMSKIVGQTIFFTLGMATD